MNNKNNSNIVNEIRETEGWRSKFFNKELCEGIIENTGDGNITITGKLKIDKQSAKIIFWAANPPDYNTSFSGSGLPFPSPEIAFEDTKNQRRIIKNRLDSTNFSPEAFVNAGIEEINLFKQALDIEISLIQGYFSYLHQNQELNNHIRIKL